MHKYISMASESQKQPHKKRGKLMRRDFYSIPRAFQSNSPKPNPMMLSVASVVDVRCSLFNFSQGPHHHSSTTTTNCRPATSALGVTCRLRRATAAATTSAGSYSRKGSWRTVKQPFCFAAHTRRSLGIATKFLL